MNREDILKCIKNNLTAAEMANKLKVHDLNLYNEINKLERDGYTLSRNYFSDGNFKYSFGFKDLKKKNSDAIDIVTKSTESDIKILCLSDLHLTSKFENKGVMEYAYKYAEDSGIHLIMIGGDILHGKYGATEYEFADGIDQIKRFIDEYPFRNNILTFGIGGDHDFSIFEQEHIDPLKVITQARHDIVLPSYRSAVFRIKNSPILLTHKINRIDKSSVMNLVNGEPIILSGHYHEYETTSDKNQINIKLPTASNMTDNLNGFIVLTLHYEDDVLTSIRSIFKSVIYKYKKFSTISVSTYEIETQKEKLNNVIDYINKEINNPYKKQDIIDYEKEYNDINEKVQYQEDRIDRLESEKRTLKSDNEELNEQLTQKKLDNVSNKEKISLLNKELEIRDSKIFRLKEDKEKLKDANIQLGKNNKDLSNRNIELLDELKKMRKELEEANNIVNEYNKTKEETTIFNDAEIVKVIQEEIDITSNGEVKTEEVTKENVVEEVAKVFKIVDENTFLTSEERYEFRLLRMEEYRKVLKKELRKQEQKEKEQHRKEFLEKANNFSEELTYDELMKNEEFTDKMCDVMDNVTMELSGKEEKQRTLKANKSYKKVKKIMTSQKSKQERIEELKKKASK